LHPLLVKRFHQAEGEYASGIRIRDNNCVPPVLIEDPSQRIKVRLIANVQLVHLKGNVKL
jgi:hypothetical protein